MADYPGWQAKLSSYSFYVDVPPPSQGADTSSESFYLYCTVTDSKTGAQHKISVTYSPGFSGLLQGTVDGSDDDYEITINTNSSVLIQHIQWALALPNTTKVFFVGGSSNSGNYPYAVNQFSFWPLTAGHDLVAAEGALPEISGPFSLMGGGQKTPGRKMPRGTRGR